MNYFNLDNPRLSELKKQFVELQKSYYLMKQEAIRTALAAFNKAEQTIIPLVSLIKDALEGRLVTFSPTEQAILTNAARNTNALLTVQPFLSLENIAALKSKLQTARALQRLITRQQYALSDNEEQETSIPNKNLEAPTAISSTVPVSAESLETKYIGEEDYNKKPKKEKKYFNALTPEQRIQKEEEQKQHLSKAKKQIDELQSEHKILIIEYEKKKLQYEEELKKYEDISEDEKLAQKPPVPPVDPDETLLDGVKLSSIYEELSKRMTPEKIHSSKINKIGTKWYCGPSAIGDVAMVNDPEGYYKAVIELATKGKTRFFKGCRKLKLPKHLKNGTTSEILDWTNEAHTVDLIFGGTVRHVSNGFLKRSFKKHSLTNSNAELEIFGKTLGKKAAVYEGTFPNQPSKMLKMLGLKVNKKNIRRSRKESDITLLIQAVDAGLTPIILDNYAIKKGTPSSDPFSAKKGLHYMPIYAFKSIEDGKYEITYWEYGAIQPPVIRTKEQILQGMKGYWIPEPKKRS